MFLTLIERRYKNYPVVSVGMFVERLFPRKNLKAIDVTILSRTRT